MRRFIIIYTFDSYHNKSLQTASCGNI